MNLSKYNKLENDRQDLLKQIKDLQLESDYLLLKLKNDNDDKGYIFTRRKEIKEIILDKQNVLSNIKKQKGNFFREYNKQKNLNNKRTK